MKNILSSLYLLLLLLVLPAALHAQVINSLSASGAFYSSGSSPIFTYETTSSDPYWAQFGVSGTDAGTSLVNVKAAASSAVTLSPLTESGDSDAAYTQGTSGIDFVYTDGSSPASSTTTIPGSDLNQGPAPAGEVSVATGYGSDIPSATLSFTITFNQAVSKGTLDLVANNYQSSSTFDFTFSSDDATKPVDDPHPVFLGNDDDVYTLSFSDVPMGSVLTVTDTMSTVNGGNTSITGLAFTVLDAPEPSTWAMMVAGLVFLGFRIRRKSV